MGIHCRLLVFIVHICFSLVGLFVEKISFKIEALNQSTWPGLGRTEDGDRIGRFSAEEQTPFMRSEKSESARQSRKCGQTARLGGHLSGG
jgi:hypothetical protein